MPYGRYFTRGALRVTKRAGKDAAKTALGTIGAGYIKRLATRRSTGKKQAKLTKGYIPKYQYDKKVYGKRSSFNSYKARPISNKLKGVSKKFVKKVEKVINNNESWGEHIWVGNKQLRQIEVDEYNLESQDEVGNGFFLDTPQSIISSASRLYLGKVTERSLPESLVNGLGQSDTIDRACPIKVITSKMDMFFKSTSSHVVNLQLFECTSKGFDLTADARDWADASFDDYEFTGDRLTTPLTNGIRIYGVDPRHMTSLHNHFHVKVHSVKLLPGESSSITIKGQSKTHDFSQMMAAGSGLRRWPKGAKSMFFRIINDVSVSTSINRVHAFPSNSQGGVAMRYTRTYRIAPPKTVANNIPLIGQTANSTKIRNIVVVSQTFNLDGLTDQQVCYYNPANKTTTD